MIDNSLYDPKKQIWIILELYFESYEFSNFQGIFWFFYVFIWTYFEFKRIKNQILSRIDVADDVVHVKTASPRGARVCVHTCVRVCVCARTCAWM